MVQNPINSRDSVVFERFTKSGREVAAGRPSRAREEVAFRVIRCNQMARKKRPSVGGAGTYEGLCGGPKPTVCEELERINWS